MEIDLNNSVSEKQKDECVFGGFCSASPSSCSSNAASGSSSPNPVSSPSICKELWHACAGPLTSLPKKGNVVVYLPQGHLEVASSASSLPPVERSSLGLPPHVFCRVMDVQLLANRETDEVYTKLTLLPLPETTLCGEDTAGYEEGNDVFPSKLASHMFCKTLTASDTSTHGGFSVPRRAAEDCFPPLDYKEQRPSQELIAKDLHGVPWKFRHIYRGQPRRHLLTTGWSIFVGQKNLLSGDAVLFLRGAGGELRLGIRRASRSRNILPDSIKSHSSSYASVLSAVANAFSSNSPFSVFYSPRASHAEFIIPYQKYVKATATQIPLGAAFKMRFGFDDSPERSGVVTGISDMDPYRWPNSKWRCLMVRWDDDALSSRHERVSPWEIRFSANYPPLRVDSSPRIKKIRSHLQETMHCSSLSGGGAVLDFEESTRPSRVLQGQENVGLMSPRMPSTSSSRMVSAASEFVAPPTTFTGFLESNWFPKVLQGQEICSLRSLTGKRDLNLGYSRPQMSFYPLASEGARNVIIPQKGVPCFLDVPPMSRVLAPTPVHGDEQRVNKKSAAAAAAEEKAARCKIFGFSLAEDPSTKSTCIKVHKQGSLVGRGVDLSRLYGYDDLLMEIERLFGMEGLLRDPEKGWRVLFTDDENDTMVVGDYPWHEFVEMARKLHVYTGEEVEKMSIVANNDDSKSCLEEAPPPPPA